MKCERISVRMFTPYRQYFSYITVDLDKMHMVDGAWRYYTSLRIKDWTSRFCYRCPVRSTITGYGVSISNEEYSRAGFFIGRGKIESFNVIDQEPIRLDYRAKICTGQCRQVLKIYSFNKLLLSSLYKCSKFHGRQGFCYNVL